VRPLLYHQMSVNDQCCCVTSSYPTLLCYWRISFSRSFLIYSTRWRYACAGIVPPLPIAEEFVLHPDDGNDDVNNNRSEAPADFVFMYDYACGALLSVRARMRRMKQDGHTVPESVWSWARSCKFRVDKFNMKNHVGAMPLFHAHASLDIYAPISYFSHCR
jgi:hypothetical protein